MSLSDLLHKSHDYLFSDSNYLRDSPDLTKVLFFSFSDGKTRAKVIKATGKDFQKAWVQGASLCHEYAEKQKINISWLRIDWPKYIRKSNWADFKKYLYLTKRNYFRLGISLDEEFKHSFLETEINANAMLYISSDKSMAGINKNNFMAYAKKRFGNNFPLDLDDSLLDQKDIWLFVHEGIFISDANIKYISSDDPAFLPGPGSVRNGWKNASMLNSGHRQIKKLNSDDVLNLIKSSSSFLSRQVKKDGQFIYGHFPCFGRNIRFYNTLRHASTIYSMLEAWELTQDDRLIKSIKKALTYLDEKIVRRYERQDGTTLAFNVDVSNEIKLGANAVSLLALVKYDELTGDDSYRALMEQLALGIKHMQKPDSGKFAHVLNGDDLSVKDEFRIVYYDGEAAFGLMRLYGLTKDQRWLNIVEQAFEYFIQSDHWKHHDHWLSYCANELTLYKPEEKYFRFGVKNVSGLLDFILTRETTYPTLLELSMAFHAMLQRIKSEFPAMQHVLEGLDIEKFYRALHHRAHYLLNGFFWPELAMFFAKPNTIVGSFFIRHHSFRVRIDDVEHYLSGYVAYWKMLRSQKNNNVLDFPEKQLQDQTDWRSSEKIKNLPNQTVKQPQANVIWGGDVNLGRRQHYRTLELGFEKVLQSPALAKADLSIINLECVVATVGEQGLSKGESGPYYYRARPEMLQILIEAGVNVVSTANNHSGDYGPEAIVEQLQWLSAAGIAQAGTGKNLKAALEPVFCRAGGLQVAFFSIDTTQSRFAASKDNPGAAYLPIDSPDIWRETLTPLIAEARKSADVVLVAVHWGKNWDTMPATAETQVGYTIIDAGADAVLGTSAHVLQGIEIYRGRPIIYDAGDLLFDSVSNNTKPGGLFQLGLTADGVISLKFLPLEIGYGYSFEQSDDEAKKSCEKYNLLCHPLGTNLTVLDEGACFINLNPPPRLSKTSNDQGTNKKPDNNLPGREQTKIEQEKYFFNKLQEFDQDLVWRAKQQLWVVDNVPQDALIEPTELGPLVLHGIRVRPGELTRREMVWVETFWSCNKKISENVRLDIRAVPIDNIAMPHWGKGMDHDPCDWMMPTTKWEPDTIYRDYYGLRPPLAKNIENGKLQVSVGIVGGQNEYESLFTSIFIDINKVGKNSVVE